MRSLVAAVCCALIFSVSAAAQPCADGSYNRETGSAGAGIMIGSSIGPGVVNAATLWDPDGAGPLPEGLVVAGRFDELDGVVVHNVAYHDGAHWRPVGDDSLRLVRPSGLAVVTSLCVRNGDLFVAGRFDSLEGAAAPYNNLAYWDGASWQRIVGAGGSAGVGIPQVASEPRIESHDGRLILVGTFTVPGSSITNLAAWDGISWTDLGFPSGTAAAFEAVEVVNDQLFVGITPAAPTLSPLWRHTSATQWTPITNGLQLTSGNRVLALSTDANELLVGGNLATPNEGLAFRAMALQGQTLTQIATSATAIASIARADGSTYTTSSSTIARSVGAVLEQHPVAFSHQGPSPLRVRLLGVFGGRPLLGGSFGAWTAPQPVRHQHAWSLAWLDDIGPISTSSGFDGRVTQFVRAGGDVFAVGAFSSAGGFRAQGVARFSEGRWRPVGDGTGFSQTVWCAAEFNGEPVVGGGDATPFVSRWNGSAWEEMGSLPRPCRELVVANGTLYARVATVTADSMTGIELFRWTGAAWESVTTERFFRLIILDEQLYGLLANTNLLEGHLGRLVGNEVVRVTPANAIVFPMGVHAGKIVLYGTFPPSNWTTHAFDPVSGAFSAIGTGETVVCGFQGRADIRTDVEYQGELFVGSQYVSCTQGGGPEIPLRWNGSTWRDQSGFRPPQGTTHPVRCSVPFVHGEELWIAHGGVMTRALGAPVNSTTQGQASWSIWEGDTRPVIIDHPRATTTTLGGTAVFTVITAPDNLTYRWRRNGVPLADGPTPWGSIISGATTPTLTISNVQLQDGPGFTCLVSDGCSQSSSRGAALILSFVCDTIDFNADGLFPDSLDIEDFLTVFGGGACSNDPNCGDVDFNNDGLYPDQRDIEAFLVVYAGGACF
jgi:hypothetical protein